MNNRPEPPRHVTEGGKDGKKSSDGNKSPFGNPNAQRMWIVLGIIVLALALLVLNGRAAVQFTNSWPMNRLLDDVQQGRVERIDERGGGRELLVTYTDNTTETVYKNPSSDFYTQLQALGVTGVDYYFEPTDDSHADHFPNSDWRRADIDHRLVLVADDAVDARRARPGNEFRPQQAARLPRFGASASDIQGCRRRR